jgi:two-component system, cell cycle response regulator
VTHILLIEDNHEDSLEFSHGIRGAAYSCGEAIEVDVARDLVGARALMKARTYDCIISDLNVPPHRGKEIIEILKQETDSPVIAISGAYYAADSQNIIKAGAEDFILKSANGYDRILRMVHSTIARCKRLSDFKKRLARV